jgi:hypothetical protein
MAVEGEGGMNGSMLRHFYNAIQAAAVAVHGKDVRAVVVGMHGVRV